MNTYTEGRVWALLCFLLIIILQIQINDLMRQHGPDNHKHTCIETEATTIPFSSLLQQKTSLKKHITGLVQEAGAAIGIKPIDVVKARLTRSKI
jgi:hypothetical protein